MGAPIDGFDVAIAILATLLLIAVAFLRIGNGKYR